MEAAVCISGATGGLGKAFAVECAHRGWDLFLTDLSGDSLSGLASCLSRTYGISIGYRACDLTDADSREGLFRYLRNGDFKFRGLINVAGIDFEGSFADREPGEIRTILRVNIEANLELTHAVLKLRDGSVPFRLINVASLAAFYPMPIKAVYAASKRFLLDFSLALREELRTDGGTVTVLCPAGMRTQLESVRAIASQGLMGSITTKNIGWIASGTLDRALKGRLVYIPGFANRVLRFIGGLFPPSVVAKLISGRWKSTRSRRPDLCRYPEEVKS